MLLRTVLILLLSETVNTCFVCEQKCTLKFIHIILLWFYFYLHPVENNYRQCSSYVICSSWQFSLVACSRAVNITLSSIVSKIDVNLNCNFPGEMFFCTDDNCFSMHVLFYIEVYVLMEGSKEHIKWYHKHKGI